MATTKTTQTGFTYTVTEWAQIADFNRRNPGRPTPVRIIYATDRPESEPCQAGTPGCSVDHTHSASGTSCEGW